MTKSPFFSLSYIIQENDYEKDYCDCRPRMPCVMAPHFPYIIFPGNVGNEQSLREVYLKLK